MSGWEAEPPARATQQKGPRTVCSMNPAQLERKRAHDRESQRAARARTRHRIESLELEVTELRTAEAHNRGRDAQAIQELMWRNKLLEEELSSLKEYLQSVSRTSSPYYASEGSALSDTNAASVNQSVPYFPETERLVYGDRQNTAGPSLPAWPAHDFEPVVSPTFVQLASSGDEPQDRFITLDTSSFPCPQTSQFHGTAAIPANASHSLPLATPDDWSFQCRPARENYNGGISPEQRPHGARTREDCQNGPGQYQNGQPENG